MKKMTKKLGAIVLALAMCFSLCCTALAAPADNTITIVNATEGQTYYAYKVFDAQTVSGGVVYTINKNTSEWYAIIENLTTDEGKTVFTLSEPDADGNCTVTAATDISEAEVITALQAALQDYYNDGSLTGFTVAASATADNETVVLEVGDSGSGYYFVTTTNGSTVSITTAEPNATIIDKNTPPSVEKDITNGLDTDDSLHGDTEAMGDDVEFTVTANAPLYTSSEDGDINGGYLVTDYTFTDHMSAGLEIRDLVEGTDYTIDTSTGETHYYATLTLVNQWVKLNGESIYNYAYNVVLELTDPTYYFDENGDQQIQFDGFILSYTTVSNEVLADLANNEDGSIYQNASDIITNYPVSATVEIDYTAHVTGEVDYDNTNEIDMDWHMTPFNSPHTPEYTGHGDDDNDIYVLGLDILKVDGSDGITPLAGATFELSGENLKEVVTNEHEEYIELNQEEYRAALAAGTELWFELVDGGYTNVNPYTSGLSEEELEKYKVDDQQYAPDTYPYVANTREITYTTTTQAAEDKTVTGTTDANGVLSFEGLTEGTWTLTETKAPDGYNLLSDPIVIEITLTDWTTDGEPIWNVTVDSGSATIDENGVVSLTVENNNWTELPSTGGIGTTIFYIIGGVLVVGAVVVLVTRRRVNREA